MNPGLGCLSIALYFSTRRRRFRCFQHPRRSARGAHSTHPAAFVKHFAKLFFCSSLNYSTRRKPAHCLDLQPLAAPGKSLGQKRLTTSTCRFQRLALKQRRGKIMDNEAPKVNRLFEDLQDRARGTKARGTIRTIEDR
jgi:hypothetical protein